MRVLSIVSIALVIACVSSVAGTAFVSEASAKTRSLKLYYLHTGERADIIYKRNGKYVKSGLKKINRFLRDWRRNEPTKMDPRLLDLVWEVYRESGSRKHIHVISGYRSPKTNSMLRKRGRGVASKSQHTYGKALDFYLPDVKLSKLRRIGLIKQAGGVGYYPKSGSPFVHLDTGRVRHWPRMSRSQLVRVFPNGKTLHVPSDGKPLKGFNIAKARYDKRKRGQGKIVVSNEKELPKKPKPKKPGFFQRLVTNDEKDDNENVNTPAPKPVKTTVEKPVQPKEDEIPAQTEEELVIASLPDIVPVPRLAPRVASEPQPVAEELPVVTTDQAVVIAQVNELVTPQLVPNDRMVNEPPADIRSAAADLVPEPRPSSAFDEDQSNILALADPSQEPTKLRAAVAASSIPADLGNSSATNGAGERKVLANLSQGEIQDIRNRLRNTYGASNPVRPGVGIPRPVAGVGAENQNKTLMASFDRFAPNKQNVGIDAIKRKPINFSQDKIEPTGVENREFETASLAPDLGASADEVLIGIPTQKPVGVGTQSRSITSVDNESRVEIASIDPNRSRISASNEVSQLTSAPSDENLLAELKRLVSDRKNKKPEQEPVEPGIVTTGVPALPSANPARLALATIVEPGEAGEDPSYVVSLLPIESDPQETSAAVAPDLNTALDEQEEENLQVASLSPIEPGTISTDQIALPISNPERLSRRIEILNKLAEQAKETKLAMIDETNVNLAVGSIFVVPTPRPGLSAEAVQLASLRDDLKLEFDEEEAESETAIMPRINRSLAEFSMPEFNDNGIGKFALANDRSIKEISDIQPPAYGRNAILELPSAVLKAGFSQNPDIWKTNQFTGRAVQRIAFAKFEK